MQRLLARGQNRHIDRRTRIATRAGARDLRAAPASRPEATRKLVAALALAVCAVTAACDRTSTPAAPPAAADDWNASALKQVPLADVAGPADFDAGEVSNPVEGDAQAIQTGRTLYMSMNCAYCHGIDAGGLIGPSLKDAYWRYGGSAAEIYLSIHDGRPKGMPAWRGVLPKQSLWQLTAYIQSLQKSTEGMSGGPEGRQHGAGGGGAAR